jgi:phosphoenolpyruvate-protein phosphotransferase (PTS system enzyme I)
MHSMTRIQGVGGCPGIAIGRVHLLTPRLVVVDRRVAKALIPKEVARLQAAIIATDDQLAQIERHLAATGQHESHLILGAHRMMLKSAELGHSARALVQTHGLAAESAVRRTIDRIGAVFDKVRDPYLRDRGGDLDAVGE